MEAVSGASMNVHLIYCIRVCIFCIWMSPEFYLKELEPESVYARLLRSRYVIVKMMILFGILCYANHNLKWKSKLSIDMRCIQYGRRMQCQTSFKTESETET